MKFQKGQSVVEFAIVLPLFLLLVFGICYFGMIFADYLTLSNVARSSAREAAILEDSVYQKSKYTTIIENEKYKNIKLLADLYSWDSTKSNNFAIIYKDHNVIVTIRTDTNDKSSLAGLSAFINNMLNRSGKDINLNITYTMYSENTHTN